MNKIKKLVLTVAALAALAVGGAAFASAQNSSPRPTPTTTHQSSTEAETPGDSDGGQVPAEQNGLQGRRREGRRPVSKADGEQNDAAEAASEASRAAASRKSLTVTERSRASNPTGGGAERPFRPFSSGPNHAVKNS